MTTVRSLIDRTMPWLVVAAIYTFYFRWFTLFVVTGEHPDEPHHITYVMDVVKGGWIPDYSAGASASYLEHPALYYTLVGKYASLAMDPMIGMGVANYVFGLASVLVLYDFARTVSGSELGGLVAAVCASMVPFFVYLTTGVNNDNLATLLVFCTASFAARYYLTGDINWFIRSVLPVLIVTLVKMTAAIQAGVLILPAAFMILRQHGPSAIWTMISRPNVAAALIAVMAYYITIIAIYGQPFPRPVQFFDYALKAAPQAFRENRIGLIDYMAKFRNDMLVQMSSIYSHKVYRSTTALLSFWSIVYIASFAALFIGLFNKRLRWICASLILALVVFGVMNFTIMYRSHLANGYLGGLQFRYYLPLTGLSIATAIGLVSRLPLSKITMASLAVLCLYMFIDHDAKRFMLPAFLAAR